MGFWKIGKIGGLFQTKDIDEEIYELGLEVLAGKRANEFRESEYFTHLIKPLIEDMRGFAIELLNTNVDAQYLKGQLHSLKKIETSIDDLIEKGNKAKPKLKTLKEKRHNG